MKGNYERKKVDKGLAADGNEGRAGTALDVGGQRNRRPAAYAVARTGVRPVLVEPEPGR